ncbi:ATP-binding protein [Nonomuraea sp. LPB2021202275-12-8]|uniref:ATP-binding protein n=1 Tax=Nonomuraea sp. LPB2021202275-12-8 TaxID=3120159 RepID=UPI00300D9630
MNAEPELRCPITEDLGGLRSTVRTYAEGAGLSGPRLEDLVLAVNEAAANVLEHAGGVGTVTASSDGGGITVEILDDAGTLTPGHLDTELDTTTPHGFGLWTIRRLCDQVTLDHPAGHTRLRLRMQGEPAARRRHAPARRSAWGGRPAPTRCR